MQRTTWWNPAPAAASVPELERILLNTLLVSEEARRGILPRLREMPQVEQFVKRRVFQTLFAMTEAGSRFSFSEFEARLADADRDFIAQLVFADEAKQGVYTYDEALHCLEALERAGHEARRATLKQRIRDAERAGMLEEALRMTEELARLDRA